MLQVSSVYFKKVMTVMLNIFKQSPHTSAHHRARQASIDKSFDDMFGSLSWSMRWGHANLEPDVVYLRCSKYTRLTPGMKNLIPKSFLDILG